MAPKAPFNTYVPPVIFGYSFAVGCCRLRGKGFHVRGRFNTSGGRALTATLVDRVPNQPWLSVSGNALCIIAKHLASCYIIKRPHFRFRV